MLRRRREFETDCGDLNLNSASLSIVNYYSYFLSFCCLNEKNVVNNLNGGMLDVVLIQESVDTVHTSVDATDGIVKPDNYHPPLDVYIKIKSTHISDIIEPSNIDNSKDWNFKICNRDKLSDLLSRTSWEKVLQTDDVCLATKYFYETVYTIFDACIPKKLRCRTSSRRYPVWFTKDIINDIRLKLRLHTAWKRTNCCIKYKNFSDLRASLKTRVAFTYASHTKNIENNLRTNPRNFWQHVSSLRSKGGFEPNVTYKGDQFSGIHAAGAFADFFASVYLPDIPLLDAERVSLCDSDVSSNYVNIFKFTHQDVLSGINKLKLNSSVGPDNIPSDILKSFKTHFCLPLQYIFNLCLKCGIYPPQWKISRVTPIPKSQNKTLVEEFRPIAILSSPAKVFENVLHNYIYSQVEKYLCDEQHGFRAKRSVNTNLLTLVDYISKRLDHGGQVDVLYFDFRKAFDRVNNDILLAKLCAIGFPPGLLRLLADYLRDRQQFVRLGHYESQPYHTRSGVSQGSILGPLLFLIMVNDLPSVIHHAKSLLYADDLKLFSEVKSEADCLELQCDLNAILEWSVRNKMEFNSTKCFIMSFTRARHPINFVYKMNHSTITRTSGMKDLGVTFDMRLTFHDHMVLVAKDSFRRLGFILRNAKDFKNISAIKSIFNVLVRSKLESSACVWNPHEKKYTLILEKVQKAFLRYLYKRLYGYYPFLYPSNFLLGCLGYNSLEVRRKNDQIINMCKIFHGKTDAPLLHDELSHLFAPVNYRRSRRHRLFAVPGSRTVARAQSPIPRTLAALNALLDAKPDCDVFADEWKKILSVCLEYCEMSV